VLKKDLADFKADDPEMGVVVKGDDNVDYQHMVSVLDVLQSLDIQKVGMATQ
jgi:biopolymer transport protein ExbD